MTRLTATDDQPDDTVDVWLRNGSFTIEHLNIPLESATRYISDGCGMYEFVGFAERCRGDDRHYVMEYQIVNLNPSYVP